MTITEEEMVLLGRLRENISQGVRAAVRGVPESREAKVAIVAALLGMAVSWAQACGFDRGQMDEFLAGAWLDGEAEFVRKRS